LLLISLILKYIIFGLQSILDNVLYVKGSLLITLDKLKVMYLIKIKMKIQNLLNRL